MEFDSSTVIYIIAIVVYFFYSMFFNKKAPEQQDEQMEQPEAQPRKTVSFDELLKEIRREQGERERDLEGTSLEEDFVEEETYREAKPEPKPEPKKYFTYEDPEQFPSSEKAYQAAQKRYQKYEKQPLVKLDDQVDIDSNEKILGEVEDVSGTVRRKNRYAALLKNPGTVRDAVVVSEILQRKHF